MLIGAGVLIPLIVMVLDVIAVLMATPVCATKLNGSGVVSGTMTTDGTTVWISAWLGLVAVSVSAAKLNALPAKRAVMLRAPALSKDVVQVA